MSSTEITRANASRQLSTESKPTPTLLPSSKDSLPKIAPILKRLCSMKNQTQFTAHALETWTAVLSVFPVKIVNRAVLRIGLSVDPFPDLGKVVIACQQESRDSAQYAPGLDAARLSQKTLTSVAAALQVEI